MIRIGNQRYSLNELWKVKKSLFFALTSPRKITNLLKVKYSEFLRKPVVLGYPYSVFIESSSYCNLRCPMCLKLQKNSPFDNKNMTLEEYKKVLNELGPTMLTLRFWNYGEPLINKNIFEMVKIAKNYNIFTVLSTNGALLDENASRNLLESGLDFLIISFDGASREVYEKNRKNGAFETVCNNVENFMKLRETMKKKDILISLQFIVMKTNENEVDNIKNIANKFKVDKLMIRGLNVVSKQGKELMPNLEDYSLVKKKKLNKREINFCSNLWSETVINSTGEITPCCIDAGKANIFGNIFDDKFSDIWNNKKYVDFRKNVLKDISSVDICSENCYKKGNKINFIS